MPSDLLIPFYISYLAVWMLLILQSLVLLGVVRIVYQLQRSTSPTNLAKGHQAPEFSAVTLAGAKISNQSFAGQLTALLFISPTCQSCKKALREDMEYLRGKANENVIVICKGHFDECIQLSNEYHVNLPVVADENDSISRLYNISSVPLVVLIDKDNRIQSYGEPFQNGELETGNGFQNKTDIEVQTAQQLS